MGSDGSVPAKSSFYTSIHSAAYFRGKFLDYLEEAFAEIRLEFHGQLRELAHPVCSPETLGRLSFPSVGIGLCLVSS